MLNLRIETIIVILIIYAIRKGNRRNELRPYSRDFGLRYVDENMRIAMREDASNPLFTKGHFRKNYKRSIYRKMSNLKGFYFCQFISIIQSVVLLLNLLDGFYIRYINMGGILGVNEQDRWQIYIIVAIWICVNMCLNLSFGIYYISIINNTRKKNFEKLCRKGIISIGKKQEDGYELNSYPEEIHYEDWIYEVENCFSNQFRGSGWCYVESIDGLKENVHMLIEEDKEQERTRILVQMQVDILKEADVKQLNELLHKKIWNALKKNELPLERPCLTYIICVKQRSEIFENIFCRSIETGEEDCLPVGIVLDEHKIYIPKLAENLSDTMYQEMKTTIMEIVNLIPM